ncbi:MAG: cupin domain-containing protein [Acidimicrobiia bacterium]
MEITQAGAVKWNPGSSETFTGRVWSSPLSRAADRKVSVLGVMFEPGARTYWHSHPEGQVIYVTSGAGRVGSADATVVEIGAGDVIYTPAGESHWHGAGPHSHIMHLSLTTGGATVWEPRAVTDQEYNNV